MRYQVSARDDWDAALKERFGESNSIHELTDAEVIDSIIKFGRADIFGAAAADGVMGWDYRRLEFQNGYD